MSSCFVCLNICGYICKFGCCSCIAKPTLPSWNSNFDLLINIIRTVVRSLPILTADNLGTYRSKDQTTAKDKLPQDVVIVKGEKLEGLVDDLVMSYHWVYPVKFGPPSFPLQGEHIDRIFLLYLHGGGFVQGSADAYNGFTTKLAHELGVTLLVVNYRLAPEFPYPVPEEDCFAAYKWLVERVDPNNIFIGGDSAGAALSVGALVRARNSGLAFPRGCIFISPWVDIFDKSRESFTKNMEIDYSPVHLPDSFGALYIPSRSNEHSAINQDLQGFPPMLVEYGACEMFADQIDDFTNKAREQGVGVTANKYEDMVHVFQLFYLTKQRQCQESFDEMKKFIVSLS
jgi:epsilon-lactone hydrolase